MRPSVVRGLKGWREGVRGRGERREPPGPQPAQGARDQAQPHHTLRTGEREERRRSDFPPLPPLGELANLPKQRCGPLILGTHGTGGGRSLQPPLYLVPRTADPQEGMEAAEMCWGLVQSGVGRWGPHWLEARAGPRLWLSGHGALSGKGHSGQESGVGHVGL